MKRSNKLSIHLKSVKVPLFSKKQNKELNKKGKQLKT